MAHLEYPKYVYIDADPALDSRLVQNADEETAAKADGFKALPRVRVAAAPEPMPEHLEFPKHVYQGGDVAAESRLVKNADEQAAALADGFAPLGVPLDGQVHGEASTDAGPSPVTPKADAPKPPKVEKPKAPRKPRVPKAPKPPKA